MQSSFASTRCERGGDTQKAKLASRLVIWAATQSVEMCNQVVLHACDGSVVAACKAKLFSFKLASRLVIWAVTLSVVRCNQVAFSAMRVRVAS